ncbi:MAG: hypothetical protein K2X41_02050 [Hyphomicrobium sp.]|nr:hypothetical protein [Hyphomicrobium sp.]
MSAMHGRALCDVKRGPHPALHIPTLPRFAGIDRGGGTTLIEAFETFTAGPKYSDPCTA